MGDTDNTTGVGLGLALSRGLTEAMVLRHTDFKTLQQYLDGYSVAGDALLAMQIPATLLTARPWRSGGACLCRSNSSAGSATRSC